MLISHNINLVVFLPFNLWMEKEEFWNQSRVIDFCLLFFQIERVSCTFFKIQELLVWKWQDFATHNQNFWVQLKFFSWKSRTFFSYVSKPTGQQWSWQSLLLVWVIFCHLRHSSFRVCFSVFPKKCYY